MIQCAVRSFPSLNNLIPKAGTRRSLIFSAVGAVIGLGIAGYGLFTAKGTETATVPAEDVALVNSKPLLVADFEAQLQALYNLTPAQATVEQKQKVLSDMIREELFVQRGLEVDEPSVDPDVRAALVNAVDQQAASEALSKEPTESELQVFYAGHREKYSTEGTVLLKDLIAVDPSKTRVTPEMVQALRSGLSVIDAAKKFDLKESGRVHGEEFYFAAKIHLGDTLFAEAVKLKNGQISDPVSDNGVLHILVMEKNIAPVALDFENARSEVLNDYRLETAKRMQAGEESFLEKRARIQRAPGYQE